jgi:phospholipid/cholesterol/gamma-HCH transport system substrate-binding protein
MIGTKILRLVALFTVMSVVGISYVALRYVGADSLIGLGPYTVKLQLAESGGIFPDASVSYRGVEIGKVGDMRVTPQGLEVDLEIEQDSPEVPASSVAVIANRSAVGEQYVDLQPPSNAGPYLEDESIIPIQQTRTPVPVDQLLADVDALATSVPLPELRQTVDELYLAFDRAGPDLQRLLDASNVLIPDAIRNLPQTVQLLRDGRIVLNTQAQLGPQILSLSRDLQLFTAQLKADDPNLRRLVTAAPPAARELEGLIRDVGPDLSRVLANLLTVTRILEPRQSAIEQVLVTYPALSAAAPTVVPQDGENRVHFGLVLNLADPPYCRNGYLQPDSGWRPATDLSFIPMDTSVRCDEAPPVNPRGAQNLPPPYNSENPNSENPGDPAEGGDTNESQNEQQDATALASLPAGGVLGGATEGAPPVIIPGLTASP